MAGIASLKRRWHYGWAIFALTFANLIVEGGVKNVVPVVFVALRERQRVTVTIFEAPIGLSEDEWLDTDCLLACAGRADDSISLESVREALSKIPGSLTVDFISEREER